MNPFEYSNSINDTKEDIMYDDIAENQYNPFMINRQLSYFRDTIMIANAMNERHLIDKKLQYHFLLNIVRKRKRFSKWFKPEPQDDVEVVKKYYGYSNEKARQVLPLLTPQQLEQLKEGLR